MTWALKEILTHDVVDCVPPPVDQTFIVGWALNTEKLSVVVACFRAAGGVSPHTSWVL